MPNFQIPRLASGSVDLFINTGSLSEMDYHTVEEYISQIVRTCKLYFFHENSDRAILIGGGHIEVPSSKFPIPDDTFKRIYKCNPLWGSGGGRYREHLYQRSKTWSQLGFDLPPKNWPSYNVRLRIKKGGDKWSEKATHLSRSSTNYAKLKFS